MCVVCERDTLFQQSFKLHQSSLLVVEGSRAAGTSEQTSTFLRQRAHTLTHSGLDVVSVLGQLSSKTHTPKFAPLAWKNTTSLTAAVTTAATASVSHTQDTHIQIVADMQINSDIPCKALSPQTLSSQTVTRHHLWTRQLNRCDSVSAECGHSPHTQTHNV